MRFAHRVQGVLAQCSLHSRGAITPHPFTTATLPLSPRPCPALPSSSPAALPAPP